MTKIAFRKLYSPPSIMCIGQASQRKRHKQDDCCFELNQWIHESPFFPVLR